MEATETQVDLVTEQAQSIPTTTSLNNTTNWDSGPLPRRRIRELLERSRETLNHGFELLLLGVVAFIGLSLRLDANHLLHHILQAVNTISLVHCIDAWRTMTRRRKASEKCRVFCVREPKLNAWEKVYERLSERYEGRERTFMLFSAFNGVSWVCGSTSYVRFLAHNPHPVDGTRIIQPNAEFSFRELIASFDITWDFDTSFALFFACFSFSLATVKVFSAAGREKPIEVDFFAEVVRTTFRTTIPTTDETEAEQFRENFVANVPTPLT